MTTPKNSGPVVTPEVSEDEGSPPPPACPSTILSSILAEARTGASTPNSTNPNPLLRLAPPSQTRPTQSTGLNKLQSILNTVTGTTPQGILPIRSATRTTRYTDISLCPANHFRLRLEWDDADPTNIHGSWGLTKRDYRDRTDDGYEAHKTCVEHSPMERVDKLAHRVVEDFEKLEARRLAYGAEPRRSPDVRRVLREVRELAAQLPGKRAAAPVRELEEKRRRALAEWNREKKERGEQLRRIRAEQMGGRREKVGGGSDRAVEAKLTRRVVSRGTKRRGADMDSESDAVLTPQPATKKRRTPVNVDLSPEDGARSLWTAGKSDAEKTVLHPLSDCKEDLEPVNEEMVKVSLPARETQPEQTSNPSLPPTKKKVVVEKGVTSLIDVLSGASQHSAFNPNLTEKEPSTSVLSSHDLPSKTTPVAEKVNTATAPTSRKRPTPNSSEDISPPSAKRIKLTPSDPDAEVEPPTSVQTNVAPPTLSPSASPSQDRGSSVSSDETVVSETSVEVEPEKKEVRKVRFSSEVEVREFEVLSPEASQGGSSGDKGDEEGLFESEEGSDDGLAALIREGFAKVEAEDGGGKVVHGGLARDEVDEDEDDDSDGLDYLFED